MQVSRDTNDKLARRRAAGELILLSVVFLIALALFGVSLYYFASREAGEALQNRPRGLFIGWLAVIAIGLIVGKTRQEAVSGSLPKTILVIREALQAIMLLMFFGVLAGSSYILYTSRGLALQRPWALLIGWFAVLVLIGFSAKIRYLVRLTRQK